MPITTIYIRKELHKKVKELNINMSKTLREALYKKLEEMGEKVEGSNPALILLVMCPKCGYKQNTTTIGIVRCHRCEKRYKVSPKRGRTRIISIVKGNKGLLFQKRKRAGQ